MEAVRRRRRCAGSLTQEARVLWLAPGRLEVQMACAVAVRSRGCACDAGRAQPDLGGKQCLEAYKRTPRFSVQMFGVFSVLKTLFPPPSKPSPSISLSFLPPFLRDRRPLALEPPTAVAPSPSDPSLVAVAPSPSAPSSSSPPVTVAPLSSAQLWSPPSPVSLSPSLRRPLAPTPLLVAVPVTPLPRHLCRHLTPPPFAPCNPHPTAACAPSSLCTLPPPTLPLRRSLHSSPMPMDEIDEKFGLEGARSPDLEYLNPIRSPPPRTKPGADVSSSPDSRSVQFALEHTLGDSGFSPTGIFTARIKSSSHGRHTLTKLRFKRNTLTDTEKEAFRRLLKEDGFYTIRLPSNVLSPPGRDYVISSVKVVHTPLRGTALPLLLRLLPSEEEDEVGGPEAYRELFRRTYKRKESGECLWEGERSDGCSTSSYNYTQSPPPPQQPTELPDHYCSALIRQLDSWFDRTVVPAFHAMRVAFPHPTPPPSTADFGQ
ncbi:hypothetical protein Taro_025470, partial [Colocasia esculenta]|nr:hypothetical protein [Colocasia esculenta]